MKLLQKIIATLTILALLLSPVLNIVTFRPISVKALDAGGSWANVIKETVLDAIGWTITDMVLKPLQQKIMNWGMGRTTDTNQPFPVLDWGKFFQEALDIGSAKFIAKFNATALCSPIKISLGNMPQFSWYNSELGYGYTAACTLGDVVDNVEDFFRNPNIGFYGHGLDVWLDLTNPQNNIYGSWLMASEERERMEAEEERNADKETAVSSGVKNETATTQTDTEACRTVCPEQSNQSCIDSCGGRAASAQCVEDCLGNQVQACEQRCDVTTGGFAIEKKVKNLGADIHKQLDNAMSADMQRIISADEITELIGVIFSALLNRAISGLGLFFGTQQQTTTAQRARAERKETFSYQREFKKTQTTKDIATVRSQVLSGILKAIQQLSRSIISCEEKEMMTIDDYAKNLADILAPNVEALYIGLEGVNLKPDFEVLDPRFAPYTVYGYSWGQVPAVKIPDKCREIINHYYTEVLGQNINLNTTCRNIHSGLEPNIHSECERCMYDHDPINCPPPPYPPQPYPRAGQSDPFANETLARQKSDYWWDCKNQYNATLNRCEECIKRVDEKCQQTDALQKQQCIINQCGGYAGVIGDIVDPLSIDPDAAALEFYRRCGIEERKEACYTCLKEYFMPATYCGEIKDYTARSTVKYPALVKMTRSASYWWFATGIIGGLIAGDDKGMFIGPYDESVARMGGECDDNYAKQDISVSLICRIMPDFAYGGQQICRTMCPFSATYTEEQLRDITDFRPNDLDCGRRKLDIGGREPYDTINGGVLRMRGKCCGDFWQHDPEKYAICVGTGATGAGEPPAGPCTYGLPVDQEPWCYCGNSWRPVDYNRTGTPSGGRGGDCASFGFDTDGRQLLVYTNNRPDSDTYYIAAGQCSEDDESLNNTDQNDDGVADGTPTDAHEPGGAVWTAEPSARTKWCPSISRGSYYAGVYHNDSNDVKSGFHLCVECLPGEDPTYGTGIDQCNNKIPELSWLEDCP